MITCLCEAVSDRTIRKAIADGHKTVKAVGHACRAGTCCGSCRVDIRSMLREQKTSKAASLTPDAK